MNTEPQHLTLITKLRNKDLILTSVNGCFYGITLEDLRESLANPSSGDEDGQCLITVNPTPSQATVTINGNPVSELLVECGCTVKVEVSHDGYKTYSEYILVNGNVNLDVSLTVGANEKFTYIFGEVNTLYAEDPSGITQDNWVNNILPNSDLKFEEVYSLPNIIDGNASGNSYQWWILLTPTNVSDAVKWEVSTNLSDTFLEYTGEVYSGSVTLDGENWKYTAVRPYFSSNMRVKRIN